MADDESLRIEIGLSRDGGDRTSVDMTRVGEILVVTWVPPKK